MFFKKKNSSTSDTPNLAPLFIKVAQVLCEAYDIFDDTDSLSVKLQFDTQMRISNFHNCLVNGKQKIIRPALITELNGITGTLSSLPHFHKPTGLNVTVENGKIHTAATYPKV